MECYFCKNNIKEIDFKDVQLLKNFVSGLYKIRGKKKTGTCSSHQRMLSKAVKKARSFGLLPATSK